MYGYLIGKIIDLHPNQTYLEVNGVGYEVQLTLNTFEAIQDKEICKLYTHLQIREDAWTMYGFFTELEKYTFQKLLSISGVGSATARILLSSLTPQEFSKIIDNADTKALEKVKGIGAKTAQRIILELKGKLVIDLPEDLNEFKHNTIEQDALNALLGLGISKSMAETALKKTKSISDKESTVEERIKVALKNL